MMSRLTIDRLGARGEGVAQGPEDLIFVPYALAGETIAAEVDDSRGTLVEVLTPSPHRIAPFCRYFSRCGGCAVQTLAEDFMRDGNAILSPAPCGGPASQTRFRTSPMRMAPGAGARRFTHATCRAGQPPASCRRARMT